MSAGGPPFKRTLGLTLQGVALWHAGLVCVPVLFGLLLLAADGDDGGSSDGLGISQDDLAVLSVLIGAVISVLAIAIAATSWIMLGRSFLHPQWSTFLFPGFIGMVVVIVVSTVTGGIGFIPAEIVGGFVAYQLVRTRLKVASRTDAA